MLNQQIRWGKLWTNYKHQEQNFKNKTLQITLCYHKSKAQLTEEEVSVEITISDDIHTIYYNETNSMKFYGQNHLEKSLHIQHFLQIFFKIIHRLDCKVRWIPDSYVSETNNPGVLKKATRTASKNRLQFI